jgi:hypothetical protein
MPTTSELKMHVLVYPLLSLGVNVNKQWDSIADRTYCCVRFSLIQLSLSERHQYFMGKGGGGRGCRRHQSSPT